MKKALFAGICSMLLGGAALAEFTLSVPSQTRQIADALCGDSGERDPKIYFLTGTEAGATNTCTVKITRDDLNSVFPKISVEASRMTGIRKSAQIEINPTIERTLLRAPAGKLYVQARAAKHYQMLLASFNNMAFGYQGLSQVRVKRAARNQSDSIEELECQNLKPSLILTWQEGQALADRAERTYNRKHRAKRGRRNPSQALYDGDCSLNSPTELGCSFSTRGTGPDDQPTLEATFEVKDGKIARILSSNYISNQ